MNFLLSDDLIQFREVLRSLLSKELTSAELRRALLDPYTGEPPVAQPFAAALWRTVVDSGVLAAPLPETIAGAESGGLGFGALALQIMLEESGRSLLPLPVFETLVFGALPLLALTPSTEQAALLLAVASGKQRLTGAFCHQHRPRARTTPDGVVLDGELNLVPSLSQSTMLLVVADYEAECGVFSIDVGALAPTTVPTLDLIRRFSSLTLSAVPAKRIDGAISADALRRLQSLQQLSCVAELVGVGQRVLETTVEYVKTRQQFGRPVGSFQAIQHKLADILLRVEQATSLGRFAAWAADSDPSQLQASAAAAKGFASEVIPTAVEQALQAHGGIGFTYEYDLHLFLRRARVLGTLGGPANTAYHELGQQLLR